MAWPHYQFLLEPLHHLLPYSTRLLFALFRCFPMIEITMVYANNNDSSVYTL